MFPITDTATIYTNLPQRKLPITPSIPLPPEYLHYITRYQGVTITPDIELFSYEAALRENKPPVNDQVWMIARSGQGDEWLIDLHGGHILFYDHNQGEYNNFVKFPVTFDTFLQMGWLYKTLEFYLDEQYDIDETAFRNAVNSLHPGLYDLYPYQYF